MQNLSMLLCVKGQCDPSKFRICYPLALRGYTSLLLGLMYDIEADTVGCHCRN